MPTRTILKATTTAIALAVAAAPVTAITAQSAAAQATQSYTSEELDIFTNALLRVSDVRQDYTAQLQSAETEDERADIVEKANTEIADVIENTDGITLDRYTEIAQAASEDQGLNQRIIKRVQDKAGDSQ